MRKTSAAHLNVLTPPNPPPEVMYRLGGETHEKYATLWVKRGCAAVPL